MTTENINHLFTTTADSLEVGDQIIVEDELFIIHSISESDDIDEVIVKGENLTDPTEDTKSLYADDEFIVWSI